MKLRILCIGRARNTPGAELFEDYASRIRRLGPRLGFRGLDVREWPEARASGPDQRRATEAGLLLAGAGDAPAIAMDERGRDVDSAGFAGLLAGFRDQGTETLCFVVGGADGLDPNVRDAAADTLRFGRQTWPHLLVRAMLAEQIYRGFTILSGHPYHRR